jgi:hypothetical protein
MPLIQTPSFVRRSSPPKRLRLALVLVLLGMSPAGSFAQWLGYRTPGIPRTASGAPDLQAPAPRTTDGKPDFSGMWFANVPAKDYCKERDCIQEESGTTQIYEPTAEPNESR